MNIMGKHVKCSGGWLMVNQCIVPLSAVVAIGISQVQPCTVTVTMVGGTQTTLQCETRERAHELLDAIWSALIATAPTEAS